MKTSFSIVYNTQKKIDKFDHKMFRGVKKKMQCTASIQSRQMNNCTIESCIYGYQNEPTQQQFVSITMALGREDFPLSKYF